MIEATPKQQTVELIKGAERILVVTHTNPDGDALGCLVALKIALTKLGKKVHLACGDPPAKIFGFLPQAEAVSLKIDSTSDFIISLELKHAQVERLGYKKNQQKNSLDIVVTPKGGRFREEDVKVQGTKTNYDLVIVVDTPNFERLGELALPTDVFYEVPVVNIDHHPSNERFGKINWIELVATSTAEILVSLLEALSREKPLIDEDVATALLTGLIYDTSSFQNVNTTPKSLTVAAQLVAAGARQQEIVKNLYKTKSLETLKLWGAILSNVKEDRTRRFVWSEITAGEMQGLGADQSALSGVVDELLKLASDSDFALLLSERGGDVHGSLRAIAKDFSVAPLAEAFGGGGHEAAAAFRVQGNLQSNREEILLKIRDLCAKAFRHEPIEPEPESKKPESPILPEEIGEEVKGLSGEDAEDEIEVPQEEGERLSEAVREPKTKW